MTVTCSFTDPSRLLWVGKTWRILIGAYPQLKLMKALACTLKVRRASETRMLFLSLSDQAASSGRLTQPSARGRAGPGSSLLSRSRQWHGAGKMVSRGVVCHSSAWHYGDVSLPIWQTDIIYKSHTKRRRLKKKKRQNVAEKGRHKRHIVTRGTILCTLSKLMKPASCSL